MLHFHISYETKSIYAVIDYIANKFKADTNFNIDQYNDLVLLTNEYWHDIYQLKSKIYNMQNMPKRNNILILESKLNLEYTEYFSDSNIILNACNNGYNFYRVAHFHANNYYCIEIPKILCDTATYITYGLYDFKYDAIINFTDGEIDKSLTFNFLVGNDAEGVSFLIYAGIFGKTHKNELQIPSLRILAAPMPIKM